MTKYLNFCYRLSPGEFFHLERQANTAAQENIREAALNRMLDAYNRWKLKPTSDNRRQLQEHCAVYAKLAPDATVGLPAESME